MEKQDNVATATKEKPDGAIGGELTTNEDVVPVKEEEVKGTAPEPETKVASEPKIEPEPKVEVAAPKAPKFIMEFPTEQKHYIKMLIHGIYGTGKTFLSGTAQDVPEMRNVINIDAEGGNKVLAYRGDIPTIKIRDYPQFNAIYEYLRAHCMFRDNNDVENLKASEAYFRGVDVKTIKESTIYNTVIIDSISEVVRYCMMMAKGINIESTRIDEFSIPTVWDDRNKVTENILLLIRKFRDLPMHVIFVSSSKYHEKLGKHTPNIEGQLCNEIQGFMDHVGYYVLETNIETKETHRYLMLQPGATYQAKNRFVNFKDQYITDPIFQDIYDLEVLNKSVPSRLEE